VDVIGKSEAACFKRSNLQKFTSPKKSGWRAVRGTTMVKVNADQSFADLRLHNQNHYLP
jgi:hypothetical protein